MATRQEVYSLFGIKTPQQVMAERNQQYADQLSRLSGAGQAGFGIGSGLRSLFGGESPQMSQSRQMQEALAGVDTTNPEAIKQAAQAVSSFAPEASIKMGEYALALEKSKQGAVVNVPTKIGQKPIYKQNAKTLDFEIVGYEDRFENIPHERTADGLVPLVDLSQYQTQPTADTATPDAPVPDYITNEQGVVVPNPAKTAKPKDGEQVTPAQTQEPFVPQQGRMITQEEFEAMQANTTGAGVTPRGDNTSQAVPSIARALPQGEMMYADPEALTEASNALRDQITKLEKSKDKNKAAKIKILKKRRAEIQKLRIQSRRSGAPSDLKTTGKDSDVLSGFGNVK